jgi:hypothetical protein
MPAKRQLFTAAINFGSFMCGSYTMNRDIRAFSYELQSVFLFKREGSLKIFKHI